MIVQVSPSNIQGEVIAPPSKSVMQRACAAALLINGQTIIRNAGMSNDEQVALSIIQQLGAEVNSMDDAIIINSHGIHFNKPVQDIHIDCGESGLSVRMFTPIAALHNNSFHITGSGSLLQRPMDFFETVFPQLSVDVQTNNGKLPFTIKGPMQPKNIEVDGSISSQFLTGLLMAYAACDLDHVTIQVNKLKSKPYIDLTLQLISKFGLNVPVNNDYASFTFLKQAQTTHAVKQPIDFTVEGDWSGAAFLLVAGAIASSNGITVKGLHVESVQADKKILEALMACGCTMSVQDYQIEIAAPALGYPALQAFHINATDCPDLFPPLVALAAYCNGTSVIEGVHRLTHKESNRALSLQQEFKKMGIDITFQDDLMLIKGGTAIQQSTVIAHHDHRIAMACAVAALKANGAVTIEHAEAINKSYPKFYEHLLNLGAVLHDAD